MAPGLVLARLAQYVVLLILFGTLALPACTALVPPLSLKWARRLIIAGLAATLLHFLTLSVAMAGEAAEGLAPQTLWIVATTTPAGWSSLSRVCLLIVSLAASAWPERRWLAVTCGVALASLALTGHAFDGVAVKRLIHLGLDMLHLLAAGMWIGALCAYLVLARRQPSPAFAEALARFSGTGSVLVAVLLATGLANAALIIGWPLPPINVAWTWLMALKLCLFGAMLILAALNRYRLVPAIVDGGEVKALISSLRLETLLGLCVILLVSILGELMPPMQM